MTMKKSNETLRVSNVVKNHRRIQIDKRLDAYSKLRASLITPFSYNVHNNGNN